MSSNDYKSVNQKCPKSDFENFDKISLRHTNAFERHETDFHVIANDRMLLHPSHHGASRDSLSTEKSDTELLSFDISDSFSQCQGSFYIEQTNFLVTSYDFREENTEVIENYLQNESVSLSAVGRCVRTSCEILLGMDSSNTDNLLGSFDSQFEYLNSSEFTSLDSEKEESFSEVELLDERGQNKSESKCENRASENNLIKHDSISSGLLSHNASTTSTEECNFNTRINNYRVCEKRISEKASQRKRTGEKLFQCNIFSSFAIVGDMVVKVIEQ
ncbi:hypothetical protein NPIL_311361 [Nephila pilipes]|uniref:Uncharacterized protein n=1 Tax=Nephila pilipes TaxID=299642 RepID=A0A8X6P267_NEPPI|nr:hypothetical protein NPIL_311361 [Nephila pilipes]